MAHTWELVQIETTREMEELLDWLSLLTAEDQVERLLHRRIQNSFFFDAALSPAIACGSNGKPVVPDVKRLLEPGDVSEAKKQVAVAVEKSLQFWRLLASRSVGVIAEPIILFYGIEALSEALVHATFVLSRDGALRSHGVKSPDCHLTAEVKKPQGTFPLAHAACHTDPYLLRETTWTLRELAAVNHELPLEYQVAYECPSPQFKRERWAVGWEHENELVYADQKSLYENPQKQTKDGLHSVVLHPLDYRLLTAFILSNLARYETDRWLSLLHSREGFLARSFLTKTIRSFPNIFLNQMWGKIFRIGPVARLSADDPPSIL